MSNKISVNFEGKFFVVSFTKEADEAEFLEIVECYQKKQKLPLNVKKSKEHSYKVTNNPETDIVWQILWHKYLSESNRFEKNEAGERYHPIICSGLMELVA